MVDVLEILKQRLTPLYPNMQHRFPPMPDQHAQAVAGQQQQGNPGLFGSMLPGAMSAVTGGISPETASWAEGISKTPNGPVTQGPNAISTDIMQRPMPQAPTAPGEMGGGLIDPKQLAGKGILNGLGGNGAAPVPNADGLNIQTLGGFQEPNAPMQQPAMPQQAPMQQPQIPTSTAERPRVVEGQPVTANMPGQAPQQPAQPSIKQALTRREKIEADIAALEGRDYSPPVYRDPATGETSKKAKPGYVLEKEAGANYDKNHNILDVLKGIGLGALQGAAKGGIPGMIAGGAAGGVSAGVNRNADNIAWDNIQREGLQQDLARENEYEVGGFKRDKAEADAAEAQRKPQREDAKALAEIQERQRKMQVDALKESLGLKYYKRDDPRHRAIATAAGLDPDKVPEFDDRNQVEVELDGGLGKTKVSGQSVYETQNRQKIVDVENEQEITKFNASNKLEVQKKNVDNEMKYQDDVRQVITKMAEANSDVFGGNAEVQAANNRVQIARQAIENAANAGDQEAVDKARESFDKAVADVGKAFGKMQGGSKLAAELKRAMPERPKAIKYKPVKAASTGKRVSKAKDPLGLFR